MDEYAVISLDATDDFSDYPDHPNAGSPYYVKFVGEKDKAETIYNDLKGRISNVYLVKVIKKEEYI